MAIVVSQHVRHLGFFKNFILCKTTANFTEMVKTICLQPQIGI